MTEESKQKPIAAGRQDLVDVADIIASGYAGTLSTGEIVDRRKFPYANAIPGNPSLGSPEPKKLTYKTLPRLTKENLFNFLYEVSNGAFQSFCDWIDEYKKRIGWSNLFSDEYGALYWEKTMARMPNTGGYPKFHDLPIAMQIGIMSEYFLDMGVQWEFFGDLEDLLSELIEYWYQKGLPKDAEIFEYTRIENNGDVGGDPAANG